MNPEGQPVSATGEHADEVKHVDQVAKTLPSRIFQPGALTLIVTAAIGVIAGVSGVAYAQGIKAEAKQGARDAVDAGVDEIVKAFEQHLRDDAARWAAQQRTNERVLDAMQTIEDRGARRFDALQNTVLERKAQPESAELAKPAAVKDGGR